MITCTNCGAENAANHAFCSSCGNQLAKPCPSCNTANDPANRFCFSCGTNLGDGEPAPAAPTTAPTESSGERRLVSVVFADLVGFTTFSEHRDPEDVRNMLTRYYERCREIIGRFGGTTDKFIGDAVMGVWGAVEAHEDDAERATRAALELVDMVEGLGSELGIPELSARAGVLSGEASVGSGGNEHGLVVGDLVNTASRLQSIAPPGQVYAGETTRDLAGGSIEFAPAGDHEVKGKAELVPAYRAVRVVAISSAARGGELGEAPFVGRDDELRILKDQMHATGREGRARMVSVIGEAGIGKTRLSQELLRYIDGITEIIYYHSGRSPSYGDGVTFWALGEMIRERAGILEGEDDAKSRMKLRTAVAEFAPDEEEQRWIEPRLAAVIGLTEMPPGDRSELYAALRTFFQRIAERGTVAMVFEDLHWADEGLLDFIEELVERTTQHPILVIVLARPDLLERRSDWGTARRRSLLMHLSRLDDESMRQLVSGLAPGLPDDVVERISERTAGVPLHAVEFVRMLYNTGQLVRDGDHYYRLEGEPRELSVPDSVSAIIGARLDRLDPEEASIIQDAAVLGHSFTLTAISDMRGQPATAVEGTLWQLVRSDILELDEDPRSPERGQYRFVQGLIREVAYGRLSKSERVARHLDVARRFEELRDIELAGVIAGHYAAAAAADPANVELVERARASVIDAAERAAALHSHAQAVALFAQAAAMTEDPAAVAELRLSAAEPQGNTGRTDLGIELAKDALEYFEAVGDRDGVARAATMIAYLAISEFDSQLAVDTIVPVYEAAEPEDTVTWARLAGETSRALMLHEDSEYAVTVADQVLPVLAKLELDEELVEVLINKAGAIARHGRDVEGKALLFGAAEMARQLDYLAGEIRALNNLGSALRFETHRPSDLFDRLYVLIDKSGNLAWTLRAHFYRATNATDRGDFVEARRAYEELDAADSSDFWRDLIESDVALLDAWQYGYTAEIGERFDAGNRSQLESTDPQIAAAGLANQLAMEMMAGTPGTSLPQAFELFQGDGRFVFDGASVALASAALARDATAVAELRDRIPSGSARHGYLRSTVLFGDALMAALGDDSGSVTAALEHFDEVAREFVSDFELAMSHAVLADIVGVDDPVARRLATSAAAFFDEWGLVGISDLFAGLFESLGESSASAEAG